MIVCKSSLAGCLFHIIPSEALYRSLITCRNSLFVHERFFAMIRLGPWASESLVDNF